MEPCPGCFVGFAPFDGPSHRYIGASPACWRQYTTALAGDVRLVPLSVDAYAAQHPGVSSPQSIQSVAVHLITLIAVQKSGVGVEQAVRLRQQSVELSRQGRIELRWLEPRPENWTSSLEAVLGGERSETWTFGVMDDWIALHRDLLMGWTKTVLRES